MADHNMDRRVRKTRAVLRQSLATQLQKKRIQDISVKELADMADINRGTFYLHYKDVYDLLAHIEDEMFTEFNAILDRTVNDHLEDHPSILICEIFTFIKDNQDMTRLLMGEHGDMNFVNNIKDVMRKKILNQWADKNRKPSMEEFESFYAFSINGCLGLIDQWFKEDFKRTPEELSQMAERFITGGMSTII